VAVDGPGIEAGPVLPPVSLSRRDGAALARSDQIPCTPPRWQRLAILQDRRRLEREETPAEKAGVERVE
jgi:hypothetical protein